MKWYYVIACDNCASNPFVANHDNLEKLGFTEEDFLSGVKINNWTSDVFLQAGDKSHDGVTDDVLQNHLVLPIFSQKLIRKLAFNDIVGIQYLPVRILRPDDVEIDGFSIANFTNFIAAMDYEKSEYNRFSPDFPNPYAAGKLAGVTKFVLYRDKLAEMNVVRLQDYHRAVFVSEAFRQIFLDNKFTGYSFKEIELS